MDPLDILQNERDVMPSNPYKFGAVIFLCHCVVTIRVFILGRILESQPSYVRQMMQQFAGTTSNRNPYRECPSE